MIRKFRLINGEGNTWDLNRRESFFHSIGGFGYRDGTQYEQIGTDFVPLEEMFSQGVMNGRIFFGGRDAYVNYRAFTRFVRAVPLALVYEMEEAYRVPVRLTEIGKSELIMGGAGLDCDVVFTATGLFYKNVTAYSSTLAIGGKVYPYGYPYSYADISQNTVLIESDSYEDSPCRITICGPCINPIWKHYVNNELCETGAYSGTITADHRLVIDATSIPYSIREMGIGNEMVADRYQHCDFSTERFFHLKHGQNRISVSHDGINILNVTVEGRISYETV